MRAALAVLALALPLALVACDSGEECPQALGPVELVAAVPAKGSGPAPRPPAPRPAPRSGTSGSSGFKPVPRSFKPAAPPRYNRPPSRPYVPPRYMAPQPQTVHHYHDSGGGASPLLWYMIGSNSSLHNGAGPVECPSQ